MYTQRVFHVVLLALSFFAAAQTNLDARFNALAHLDNGLVRRADETDQKTGAANSRDGDDSPTPSPSVTAQESSTTESTSSTEQSSTIDISTTSSTSSSTSTISSTTTTSSTSTSPSVTKGPTPSKTGTTTSTTAPLSTSTFVITLTASDGSVSVKTTVAAAPPKATISSQSGAKNSGMSKQTRSIIIGVVVGVGGAIVLAVVALVAWRIWGRKKSSDDNDELMSYGGAGFNANAINNPLEKIDNSAPASTAGRTPFQSTLESYHTPTQVNTASNF